MVSNILEWLPFIILCSIFYSAYSKEIPWIIYGTAWKKENTSRFVHLALANGFTAFDTANMPKHYNETLVGNALYEFSMHSKKKSSEIFLQTKFTPDACEGQMREFHPYDSFSSIESQVNQSFESSRNHLNGLKIDSLLLHSPYKDDSKTHEAFKAMKKLKDEGRVDYIGVSNFDIHRLELLTNKTAIVPDFVQNRCLHKTNWDEAVRRYCNQRGIRYQGFWLLTGNRHFREHSITKAMAKTLNCTPEQVLLAYLRQHLSIIILDGTKSESHMIQDLSVKDLVLQDFQIKQLNRIEIPASADKNSVTVTFANNYEKEIHLYWINEAMNELVLQGLISTGETMEVKTFHSHSFMIKDGMTEGGMLLAFNEYQLIGTIELETVRINRESGTSQRLNLGPVLEHAVSFKWKFSEIIQR